MSVGLDFEDENSDDERKRQARLIASGWTMIKGSSLGKEPVWKHVVKNLIQFESQAIHIQECWDEK